MSGSRITFIISTWNFSGRNGPGRDVVPFGSTRFRIAHSDTVMSGGGSKCAYTLATTPARLVSALGCVWISIVRRLRQRRERLLERLLQLRVNHDARGFPYELGSEPRGDRHDAGLRGEDQVGHGFFHIRQRDQLTALLGELDLPQVRVGAEEPDALLALAHKPSFERRYRFLLERVLQIADVPEHAFHGVVLPAALFRHAFLHQLPDPLLGNVQRGHDFAYVDGRQISRLQHRRGDFGVPHLDLHPTLPETKLKSVKNCGSEDFWLD